MDKEEIKKRKKENWFDVEFFIEAMGIDKETVEKALALHIEKLSRVKEAYVYEKEFMETKPVDKLPPNIKQAFSQVVHIKLLIKTLFDLINIVMVYGPSSIEIMSPEKKEIKIEEIQNIANTLAGLMHRFASAGAGGIVITPDK